MKNNLASNIEIFSQKISLNGMNVNERIKGLRKLIQEKCLENDEYSRILSQYESYRIKFLEDIESLMDPAHSIFSTDSDSESYDEENSESSSDASYGAPIPKKTKRSATPDQASLNSLLEKNDILNQKASIASQSVPQLNFPTITPPSTPVPPPTTPKSPTATKVCPPTPKASPSTAISALATTLSSLATAVSRSLSQPAPQQISQFQSTQQTIPLANPQNQAPIKSPLKAQSNSQPINQFAFANPSQYIQLNNLFQKLFSANTSRVKEKKPQLQNPKPISTPPQNPPTTLIEPQNPPPVPTPSSIEVVQEAEPTPTKDIKHFLYPSNVIFTQPPPIYQGTIPGHCVLNKTQTIYTVPNATNSGSKAFSADNIKAVSLISQYRKTLELLQQQQFVNLLHQLSFTQPITIEIVEMAYKLIHQNTLNWRSNAIREKLELMDLQPEIKSYLNSIVKTEDENGTNLLHLHFLESKLSLWSKANTKNPEEFITQYPEVIRPNETAKLIDCIDITSLKDNEKLKQDFIFTDESDLSV